jgi:hypothetical protein
MERPDISTEQCRRRIRRKPRTVAELLGLYGVALRKVSTGTISNR